jgi:hypothetical protein
MRPDGPGTAARFADLTGNAQDEAQTAKMPRAGARNIVPWTVAPEGV